MNIVWNKRDNDDDDNDDDITSILNIKIYK